jgi:PAS domain S-box-containing protein
LSARQRAGADHGRDPRSCNQVGVPAPEEQREGVQPSVQELYEDAPCGYLSLLLDGTVVKANRTFLRSTGYPADALLGRRLEDLLTPGSRLYYANHWRPKLDLRGEVREVPADVVRADGSRLAVLINATVALSESGRPTAIRASLFDATDRRRYERQLLSARDVEHAARSRAERLQRVSAALSDAVSPPTWPALFCASSSTTSTLTRARCGPTAARSATSPATGHRSQRLPTRARRSRSTRPS